MIKRPLYINHILNYIGKEPIKVITGIRRSGKSFILKLIMEELHNRGVDGEHILYINFENLEYIDIIDAKTLNDYVLKHSQSDGQMYILLDEIQNVDGWERAVNSFRVSMDADIYVTGSNSKLLSSEISTYIAGRYVSFCVETLSFSEYLDFVHYEKLDEKTKLREQFERYMRLGGFPVIHTMNFTEDESYEIVKEIFNTVMYRDTIQKNKIRNVDLLKRLLNYLIDNVGNLFTAKKIADFFRSEHRAVDVNTVYNYLDALESTYVIRKVNRYNIKGKDLLRVNDKYYLGDHALGFALGGFNSNKIAGVLENIVYLEFQRRGYKTYIGKLGTQEVDFVGERRGEMVYVQVCYLLASDETRHREYAPLKAINDNYPKYVVSMDTLWNGNDEGIQSMHIADFLLKKEWR